jgi:hypothetical protein
MKPDISEFSYGYALTSEFVALHHIRGVGAPVLPSLYEEGIVGYDVHIPGISLFLQFKLSDRMVRETASEAHLLAVPYYRMHLRSPRHSRQHELLMALQSRGHEVYYASPEFQTSRELNCAYDGQTVAAESAFWEPNAIGPLSYDGDHYVAFHAGEAFGYVCSDPKKVPKIRHEILIGERLRPRSRSKDAAEPAPQYWRALANELLTIYREKHEMPAAELRQLEETRLEREPRDDVVFLSHTLFGCALLFVPSDRHTA